jgi:hypothetical protein
MRVQFISLFRAILLASQRLYSLSFALIGTVIRAAVFDVGPQQFEII